ncbi:chalcone isomerase family protein [Congregibacter variabilis]|uniref:Chalcone isomerase family protein n=1 Tax=Congregibacter variabilis TaxID=3081200 RepID=A0ABZ0HZV1_9GAMM|nr:chalcone isomerase family protein [Congregibacter sp. IMCC43200]
MATPKSDNARRTRAGLFSLLMLLASAVQSNEMWTNQSAGNTAAMDVEQATLQKVGEARLKFLFWSVYDSRLYTSSGVYRDGERPLKLEIQYLLDVKANALLERTLMEWSDMGRSHPRQQQWRNELANIWTDIQSGDVLSLELDSSNRSTFRRNGELLGHIEDPEFGQEFVDIWLSDDCTRPEIRESLLGRNAS